MSCERRPAFLQQWLKEGKLDKYYDWMVGEDPYAISSEFYIHRDREAGWGIVSPSSYGICRMGCFMRNYRVTYNPKTGEVIEIKFIPPTNKEKGES